MRLPRKGILIRFAIYGALLSYFGWQAFEHYRAEQAAENAAEADTSELQRREFKLPDGRSVEVLEITPEQAEKMYGVPPSMNAGEDPPTKAPGAEEPAPEPDVEDSPTPTPTPATTPTAEAPVSD